MLQNEMDAIYSSIKPEEQREITKIFVQDIMVYIQTSQIK